MVNDHAPKSFRKKYHQQITKHRFCFSALFSRSFRKQQAKSIDCGRAVDNNVDFPVAWIWCCYFSEFLYLIRIHRSYLYGDLSIECAAWIL